MCILKETGRIERKKKIICSLIFFFTLCLIIYLMGYHITVKGVLVHCDTINKNSLYLGKADTKSYCVLFFENADTYDTIIIKKKAFFLKSDCSFWSNKTDNMIETTGGCHIDNRSDGLTTIPIVCKDEKVSYIIIRADGDQVTKNVSTGAITVFSWNKYISRADITGEAYAKDGKILYVMNEKERDNQGKDWITWCRMGTVNSATH